MVRQITSKIAPRHDTSRAERGNRNSTASEEEIPHENAPPPLDDHDEDEYTVERVLGHKFEKSGALKFHVKWLGYDIQTWEPQKNLSGCEALLAEYFESIGGRPERGSVPSKKRKLLPEEKKPVQDLNKKPMVDTPSPSVDASWEHKIKEISMEEIECSKTGEKVRRVMVTWHTGQETEHDLPTMHQKAPQKMLEYYEQHLAFKSPPAEGRR